MNCRMVKVLQQNGITLWSCARDDCNRVHIQDYQNDVAPLAMCRTKKSRQSVAGLVRKRKG